MRIPSGGIGFIPSVLVAVVDVVDFVVNDDDNEDSAMPDREGGNDIGDRCIYIGNAPNEDRASSGRMRPLRWFGAAMVWNVYVVGT